MHIVEYGDQAEAAKNDPVCDVVLATLKSEVDAQERQRVDVDQMRHQINFARAIESCLCLVLLYRVHICAYSVEDLLKNMVTERPRSSCHEEYDYDDSHDADDSQ